MATCNHGRDLKTQVCKYCSCPHGADKAACPACTASKILNSIVTNPPPANRCPHGRDLSTQFCMTCDLAAGKTSGSFTVQLPVTVGMSAEERIKHQQEEDYKRKLARMEKVPGAMRMFRTWALTDADELRAMVATHRWHKGENISTPMSREGHTGFFGFASLQQLRKQEKKWWELSQSGKSSPTEYGIGLGSPMYSMKHKLWYVSGTFLAYGHMVIAEHGGRSHFAVPEYIIEPEDSDPDFGMRIVTVAEKYGMQIISVQTALELKTGLVPYWKGRPIE